MSDHRSHQGSRGGQPVSAAAVERGLTPSRLVAVLALMAVAFMGSFNYASARGQAIDAGVAPPTLLDSLGASGGGAGGGCCGGGAGGVGGGCGGGSGETVEGSTVVEGDVQRIAVDTSTGSFSPNVVRAKAGVPIEIEFSQAPGGCLSGVWFPDLNIQEDLTGGPKTVTLPALEAGEYPFYCQMQMVSATLVVE